MHETNLHNANHSRSAFVIRFLQYRKETEYIATNDQMLAVCCWWQLLDRATTDTFNFAELILILGTVSFAWSFREDRAGGFLRPVLQRARDSCLAKFLALALLSFLASTVAIPGKYSPGMRQRLALAQVLMDDPELLILDEPTNGLDNSGVELLRTLLNEQRSLGKTILIASHSAEDIRLLCDTVIEMEAGQISFRREAFAENLS